MAIKLQSRSISCTSAGFIKAANNAADRGVVELQELDRGNVNTLGLPLHHLILSLFMGNRLPPGRWWNCYGEKGVGKSTLMGHIMACCQAHDVPQFVCDFEGGLDPSYLRKQGAVLDNKHGFYHVELEYGDMFYRWLANTLKQLKPLTKAQRKKQQFPTAMVFVDSLAGMLARAVDEADLSSKELAQVSRMHSKLAPLIRNRLFNRGINLFATNQIRTTPGPSFGNPEHEAAGNALLHMPDIRMKMQKLSAGHKDCIYPTPPKSGPSPNGQEKALLGRGKIPSVHCEGYDVIQHGKIIAEKNKVWPSYAAFEYHINIGRGVDLLADSLYYLHYTGQIRREKDTWTVNIEGHEPLRYKGWVPMSRDITTVAFREQYLWPQMEDLSGFDLYFEHTLARRSAEARNVQSHQDFLAVIREEEADDLTEQNKAFEMLGEAPIERDEHEGGGNDAKIVAEIEERADDLSVLLADARKGKKKVAVTADLDSAAEPVRKKKTSRKKKKTRSRKAAA